jgi:hypothetical protein
VVAKDSSPYLLQFSRFCRRGLLKRASIEIPLIVS